jgi:hypothetical protein
LVTAAVVGVFGIGAVHAATLDISIAAQGAAYDNLVADPKLRGDFAGALQDANLGNVSGGSNRFYANYFDDGVTLDSKMTHFLRHHPLGAKLGQQPGEQHRHALVGRE